jgi:hypothetical protein
MFLILILSESVCAAAKACKIVNDKEISKIIYALSVYIEENIF